MEAAVAFVGRAMRAAARAFRRLVVRASGAESANEFPEAGRPPEHWAARVRRGAPWLLEDGAPPPSRPAPPREVLATSPSLASSTAPVATEPEPVARSAARPVMTQVPPKMGDRPAAIRASNVEGPGPTGPRPTIPPPVEAIETRSRSVQPVLEIAPSRRGLDPYAHDPVAAADRAGVPPTPESVSGASRNLSSPSSAERIAPVPQPLQAPRPRRNPVRPETSSPTPSTRPPVPEPDQPPTFRRTDPPEGWLHRRLTMLELGTDERPQERHGVPIQVTDELARPGRWPALHASRPRLGPIRHPWDREERMQRTRDRLLDREQRGIRWNAWPS